MICVVVPTLNEAKHITGLLAQLLADAPPDLAEIIVADGGSTDGTPDLVHAARAGDPRIRLLHNPDRIQAAGINLAAQAAHPDATVLVRIDAHAGYPKDYVGHLSRLITEVGADSVVVRLRTLGVSCFQKAVAAVSNSALGTGGAAHRIGGESRWIDHGHHAAFRLARFRELGGYDTTFEANEDAEFDQRLRRSGGRIWFGAELEIDYYPRATVAGLARQYFRYGKGRARNIVKNGGPVRVRQMVPPLLVIAMAGALIAALLSPWFLLAPLAYLCAVGLAGVGLAAKGRDLCLLNAAAALPTMHLAWGCGFLSRIARGPWRRRDLADARQAGAGI